VDGVDRVRCVSTLLEILLPPSFAPPGPTAHCVSTLLEILHGDILCLRLDVVDYGFNPS